MTSKTIDMQYTPPTSDTIQTKPFPIRGEQLFILACFVINKKKKEFLAMDLIFLFTLMLVL